MITTTRSTAVGRSEGKQLDLFPQFLVRKIQFGVDWEGIEKALLTRPDILKTTAKDQQFEHLYSKPLSRHRSADTVR